MITSAYRAYDGVHGFSIGGTPIPFFECLQIPGEGMVAEDLSDPAREIAAAEVRLELCWRRRRRREAVRPLRSSLAGDSAGVRSEPKPAVSERQTQIIGTASAAPLRRSASTDE